MKQASLFFQSLCLLLLMVLVISPRLQAQSVGDTVVIETFKFTDPAPPGVYRGSFEFPAATEEYQKILMAYTLKCDPSTQADGFPCGEWDYLTYTFLTDSAGVMDSTFRSQRNYTLANGSTPDSVSISRTPVWSYIHDWQKSISYGTTTNLDSMEIGMGTNNSLAPFSSSKQSGRAQYLWRASELSALSAGDITGLRMELSNLGSSIRNLSIRIKHSMADSLDATAPDNGVFTEVYHSNTTFSGTGWHSFYFPQPFSWDGTSNLLVEFLFDQPSGGSDNEVLATSTTWPSGIAGAADEHHLAFNGDDLVDAGGSIQSQIQGATPRTIEAWAYAEAFNSGGMFQAGPTGTVSRDFSLRTMGQDDRWRVQLWGAGDFDVTLPGSKGAWHHYALVYDGGTAYLYYDGQLAGQATVALNTGVTNFRMGIWGGRRFTGKIDEVRVWDKALDATTLQSWMGRSVDNSHPDFGNLIGYYPMNEGSGTQTMDASGNGYDANLVGLPAWERLKPAEMNRHLENSSMRPNVVFEQRSYTGAMIDSTLSIDSMQQAPFQLTIYGNPGGNYIIRHDAPNQPTTPTDTVLAWGAGAYSYILNRQGQVVDSVFISQDSTLYRNDHTWYSNIVRYEIGRYITPYGINLDLGPEGTRWIFDVTDYAPLFHDWVYLQAGNNQELLDLQFWMIKGKPERKVLRVQNIYDGSFSYASIVNGNNAAPRTLRLDPLASGYRIKTRTSGHGFGGPTNCAEFCNRKHSVWVDGSKAFEWNLWNECAYNPVQPQGGTWIFDRAGWCPGDAVGTFNHELTPLVNPGDSVVLDYEVDLPNNTNPEGNYVLRTQLVSYGPIEHQLDVAIEDVLAPSNTDIHGHFNPVCDHPIIRIQNRGEKTLTSVLITYGVLDGFKPCYYRWEGNLEFLEEEVVELPRFNWTGAQNHSPPTFYAELSYPNYVQDEYEDNNYIEAPFTQPPQYNNGFIIELRTNRRANENKWEIFDDQGNLMQRSSIFLANSSINHDTVNLPDGCYTFLLTDIGQDGLDFFFNRAQAGTGSIKIINPLGGDHIVFNPDFGAEIRHQFTIGYDLGQEFFDLPCDDITSVEPEAGWEANIQLFPNPAKDRVNLSVNFDQSEDLEVEVFNTLGHQLQGFRRAAIREAEFTLDMPYPAGLYLVRVRTSQGTVTKSVVLK